MSNRKNIIIIAIMAIMLMGSVVLSAATIYVNNLHSHRTLTLEYWQYGVRQFIDYHPIGELTISSTGVFHKNLAQGDWVVKARQDSRSASSYFFNNGYNDCYITLPGPWEILPTPGGNQ